MSPVIQPTTPSPEDVDRIPLPQSPPRVVAAKICQGPIESGPRNFHVSETSCERHQSRGVAFAGPDREMVLLDVTENLAQPARAALSTGTKGHTEPPPRSDRAAAPAEPVAPMDSSTITFSMESNSSDDGPCGSGSQEVGNPSLPSLRHQLEEIFLGSMLSGFLVCVPLAFASSYLDLPGVITFIMCFFGMMPVAGMLGDLTEDLAHHTNPTIGALINISFGNLTEIVVSLAALRLSNFSVIKLSLMGSMLANGLLVLGTGLFLGGCFQHLIPMNLEANRVYHGFLFVVLMMYAYPNFYAYVYNTENGPGDSDGLDTVAVSRVVSVLCLVMYALLIVFQLVTHRHIFRVRPKATPMLLHMPEREVLVSLAQDPAGAGPVMAAKLSYGSTEVAHAPASVPSSYIESVEISEHESSEQEVTRSGAEDVTTGIESDSNGDDEEGANFYLSVGILGTCMCTLLISLLSDLLVKNVEPAANALHVSTSFIGLVLVPIVGDISEHVTVLMMAQRAKMDIAVGVALGSFIQIGLLVFPAIVVGAWVSDIPVDIITPPHIVGMLALTVLLVVCCTSGDNATWLSGMILTAAYVLLSIVLLETPSIGNA